MFADMGECTEVQWVHLTLTVHRNKSEKNIWGVSSKGRGQILLKIVRSLKMFISPYICLLHCLINIVISGVTPVSGIGGSSPSSNFPSFLPLIGSTPPNSNISQCLQQPAGSFLNSKKYIHLTCTSTHKGCHQVFTAISRLWVRLLGPRWTNI